ncbi:MAG TPA: hypothetical protein VFF89_00005 [Sphingobium sp.]|nr:hypothetical protein [Sphingobium sp.]
MDAPSRQDVERQLRLVLTSPEFESSPKLSELLYYLVTQTLAGNADRLKGYTIGVDVFDRQPDFDQGVDAIVRVQMGRLRKLLTTYYAGSGARDPIRLLLVAGRYAPRFELATGEPLSEQDLGTPTAPARDETLPLSTLPPPRRWWRTMVGQIALAGLALVILAGLVFIGLRTVGSPGGWVTAQETTAPRDGSPLVYVARYQVIGEDARNRALADGLQYDLVNQLAKFPEMAVLAIDGPEQQAASQRSGEDRKADFLLTGAIETEAGTIRVTSQLRRQRDGLVIWSDQWLSDPAASLSVMAAQTAIATTVATKIGQPYGVIPQAMSEEIGSGLRPADGEYACILSAYTYLRHKTAEQHRKVRDCLEGIIKVAPRHALAGALLAWMYGDEERYGFNRKPEGDAVGRALRVAERAVAADSHNAVAYEHLAHARFLNGTDDDGAREALETAINLHPNNSEVLADASWILGLLDGSDRARDLGFQAIELNPGHPAWYWTGPTIHALLAGEAANALKYARLNISDRGPIDRYLYAAALRLNGRAREADAELADLTRTHPEARDRAHMMQMLRIPRRLENLIFGSARGESTP